MSLEGQSLMFKNGGIGWPIRGRSIFFERVLEELVEGQSVNGVGV